ncbi:hypothetical protein NP493_592g01005 [Ridgeia piscesae]|uniref:DUF1279 domain-containing protein n=1 Tax=Ridgeia piscesae TaxID=27915 RepID=A0AAD9NP07_RIDPI|nr:hypothetical protein NP493_592g01005 [Ridgeia piscesae]
MTTKHSRHIKKTSILVTKLNRHSVVTRRKLVTQVSPESQPGDVVTEEKKGIFARFKMAYKQYGKVLIGVHLATSTVWFSSFYYAAVTGIDVIPLLQSMGVGETVLKAFSNPAIGDVAVAYLLYKIATPARYAVTIGGTHWTVRQLRRLGYMPPVPQGDSIRSLMKEGRSQMKEKASTMKDRAEDVRDKIKEKTKDHVDSMRDNMQKKKQK